MTTQTSQDTISEREFRQISDLVYRHCGINLHDGKKELVRARIAKRLRLGGFGSFSGYVQHVMEDGSGQEFGELIDAISTNLTQFFRENSHFAYLTEHFLPPLLQKKRREGKRRLRVWSAGCSTGEEPYTLGMTLSETLGDEMPNWDIKILATDISRNVLRQAEAGVYSQKRLGDVPPALRHRHFTVTRKGDDKVFTVNDNVRRLIAFRYLNLMEPWPFGGPFDFIFCRNVMIYFDKPTQESLVNRYWDCLEPGGLLFTGHSESLTGINHRFRYVQPTIYTRA